MALSCRYSLLGALVYLLFLAGCSLQAITHQAIIPKNLTVHNKHQGTIYVVTTGGREFDEVDRPWVSNEVFSRAVEETILKFNIFSGLSRGDSADYRLETGIFNIEQPYGGLDMTVKMEVGWTLKRTKTGEIIWRKPIKSEATKTVGDAFVGGTRMTIATESAIRKNISTGVSELSLATIQRP